MARFVLTLISVLLVCSIEGREEDEYSRIWREVSKKIQEDPKLQEEWKHNLEIFDTDSLPPIHFNCTVEASPGAPTSVHELRPSDVNLLAAFGDSITAGNGLGADNLPEVALQNRGEVWCIGGDKDLDSVITLANIVRQFNPDVKGYSLGYSWADEQEAWLNVAVPGNRARHMPAQAYHMVEKMEEDPRIDIVNDWKVITLFVGGNDLCGYCRNRPGLGPEAYAEHIEEAIDILHEELNRTLVNLVPMFDVTPLVNMSTGFLCDLLHIQFCNCAVNETTRPELRPVQLEYFDRLKALVDSGRWEDRNDFTVVLQTHLRDRKPPTDSDGNIDHSFFSPDCFHPGRKSHQGMAYSLWNTMLTPVGHKRYDYPQEKEPVYACPTEESPYIFTNKNSGEYSPAKLSALTALPNHAPAAILSVAAVVAIAGSVAVAVVVRSRLQRRKRQQEPSGGAQNSGVANDAFKA